MLTIAANPLAEALMPRGRLLVLGTLIMDGGSKWHLRALARQTGLSAPAAQSEANSLAEAGILVRESSGNSVYFMANSRCPIYADLKNIIVKAVGIAGPLHNALKPFSRKIQLAYTYGSFAAGVARHDSDVDAMCTLLFFRLTNMHQHISSAAGLCTSPTPGRVSCSLETKMSLEKMAEEGCLEQLPGMPEELDGLLDSAQRHRRDARLEGISPESWIVHSYQVILACATAFQGRAITARKAAKASMCIRWIP